MSIDNPAIMAAIVGGVIGALAEAAFASSALPITGLIIGAAIGVTVLGSAAEVVFFLV